MTYSANSIKLSTAVDHIVNTLSQGRSNAGVKISGTKVSVIEPNSGKGVSSSQARHAITSAISSLDRKAHKLHSEKVDAQISLAEANDVAQHIRTMLSENSVLTTGANNSVTITPAQLAKALVITPKNSHLVVSINDEKMRTEIADQLANIETVGKDASFSVSGGKVSVIPSVASKKIDFTRAMSHWFAGEHKFIADVTDVQPAHDSAWAQNLHITQLVSTFTTPFPANQIRIKNIRRAAEVVNNTVLEPNQIFSLNDALGPRTAESGYVKAPAYADGFVEQYGGGASQFSTTLFNAAWVGGYRDITHTPHSIYISRYPEGREATLNYGSIDMKFQNNSDYGMLIRASVGPTSVTVSLYSTKDGRTVTLEGPQELSRTEFTTEYTDDPTMDVGKEKETAHGYPGIVVVNYRTVTRPGFPDKKQKLTTTYHMVPRKALRGTKPVTPAPS
jgi:vancomycin resistance protein YoaR